MRNQDYGIEIEMSGLSRSKAAEVIAGHFGTQAVYEGGGYDSWSVPDAQWRNWKVVYDSSITPQRRHGSAGTEFAVELVSPICKYEDIETIQEIVRKLRRAGAMVTDNCGIHIHVNAAPHNAKTLRNIANIIASKEDMLYRALKVNVDRENYCQKTDYSFLERLNRRPPKTLEQVKSLWYNGYDNSNYHYHDSRYKGLNLHSVFNKGTIEFRFFNSTLHAGEVKSFLQLCLAISHQALTQKSARHSKTISTNEKYTFRTWLLRLGLIGSEFKTAREHLLKHLEGNIAWRDPEQAVRQRERLAQKQAEQEAQLNPVSEPEPELEETREITMTMG